MDWLEGVDTEELLQAIEQQLQAEFPAFSFESDFAVKCEGSKLFLGWEKDGYQANLEANLATKEFFMCGCNPQGKQVFELGQ